MARRNNDTEDLMDEDVDDGSGMSASEVDDMSAGGTGLAGRSTGAAKRRPARRATARSRKGSMAGTGKSAGGARKSSRSTGARKSARGGSRKRTTARKVSGVGLRKSTSGRKAASASSGARKAASKKR